MCQVFPLRTQALFRVSLLVWAMIVWSVHIWKTSGVVTTTLFFQFILFSHPLDRILLILMLQLAVRARVCVVGYLHEAGFAPSIARGQFQFFLPTFGAPNLASEKRYLFF